MNKTTNQLIKDLKFNTEKVFKDDSRYFVAKGSIDNQTILLKIGMTEYTNKQLKAEISISKKINNKYQNQFYPRYIKSGEVNGDNYFLREYADGELLGNIFGFNYNKTKKESLESFISIVKKTNKLNIAGLEKKKFNWYFNDFLQHKNDWCKHLNQKKLDAKLNYFKKQSSIIDKSFVANHGDTFPHNIMKIDSKIYFIDWGEAVAANAFLDIATIWINLWKKPRWQKIFIKEFITTKDLKISAEFFIFYFCLRTRAIIKSCRHLEENLPFSHDADKLIKFYNKTIKLILNNKFNF